MSVYQHASQAEQVDEEDVARQIVEAIKRGYIKKPRASVTGRGYVTVWCKLKYMKHGNRASSAHGQWKDVFYNLFISNMGVGRFTDDRLKITRSASERIRELVVSALDENVVETFCDQVISARDNADREGARRKHKKTLARRRFKGRALEAAKEGLSADELIDIVNEALINDVMTE